MRLELTSRSAYAIRALIAIARAEAGDPPKSARPLPMSQIAEEMTIPRRFLPQVMGDLVRAGLVTAQVGRAGGYTLARSPGHLSILEIIEAAEGDSRRSTCVLRGGPCGPERHCDAHEVFFTARSAMLERLRSATLADIVRPDRDHVTTALPE